VFVGDRGMVKSRGKQILKDADLRYIGAHGSADPTAAGRWDFAAGLV
jgi:Arc/MetJ family transcription regulator